MDIYTADGDTESNRAVIIYAYGGSFIGGSREDGYVVDFCERYARRGYVTAALDYRLYNILLQGIPDSIGMIDAVVKAVADMKGAVRFLRQSATEGPNPYGIDPNRIFVGGNSAGAITALHSAYITENSTTLPDYVQDIITANGGINGDTDLPGASYLHISPEAQAVVNMSGALHRADFVEAGGPPVVSVHGDADDTVPYGFGWANVGIPIATVQGSSMVHARAVSEGVPSELYTVAGGGHTDFYGDPVHFGNFEPMIVNFLYENATCSGLSPVQDAEDVSASVRVYPTPASSEVSLVLDNLVGETYDIRLVDQLGRTIRQLDNLNDTVLQLERGALTSGLYYLHINFHNEDLAPVNKRVMFK
jgi:acetyl esterase/lipase